MVRLTPLTPALGVPRLLPTTHGLLTQVTVQTTVCCFHSLCVTHSMGHLNRNFRKLSCFVCFLLIANSWLFCTKSRFLAVSLTKEEQCYVEKFSSTSLRQFNMYDTDISPFLYLCFVFTFRYYSVNTRPKGFCFLWTRKGRGVHQN